MTLNIKLLELNNTTFHYNIGIKNYDNVYSNTNI